MASTQDFATTKYNLFLFDIKNGKLHEQQAQSTVPSPSAVEQPRGATPRRSPSSSDTRGLAY